MPLVSDRRRPLLALLVSLTAAALVAALIPGTPARAQASELTVNVLRADWFTNFSGTFVNIEAR